MWLQHSDHEMSNAAEPQPKGIHRLHKLHRLNELHELGAWLEHLRDFMRNSTKATKEGLFRVVRGCSPPLILAASGWDPRLWIWDFGSRFLLRGPGLRRRVSGEVPGESARGKARLTDGLGGIGARRPSLWCPRSLVSDQPLRTRGPPAHPRPPWLKAWRVPWSAHFTFRKSPWPGCAPE